MAFMLHMTNFFTTIYIIAKVVFKGLLTSDWQVKKDFKVKQILDANIPNYELEHVHTVKKSSTLFTNQKKLEREGKCLYVFLLFDTQLQSLWDVRSLLAVRYWTRIWNVYSAYGPRILVRLTLLTRPPVMITKLL